MSKDTLNDYFDSVHVITLDKRKAYIEDIFSKMNIKYNQFDAIKVTDFMKNILIGNGKLDSQYTFKNNNEIGCFLSHLGVIENFYNSALNDDSNIFIFEDDIELNTTFIEKIKYTMTNIPKDWEFINFGRCWDNCKDEIILKTNGYQSIGKTSSPLCTHSYAINKKGARKILETIYPIKYPIDVHYILLMNREINPLILYTSIPRIFTQFKSINPIYKDIVESSLNNGDSQECQVNDDYTTESIVYTKDYSVVYITIISILLFLVMYYNKYIFKKIKNYLLFLK